MYGNVLKFCIGLFLQPNVFRLLFGPRDVTIISRLIVAENLGHLDFGFMPIGSKNHVNQFISSFS